MVKYLFHKKPWKSSLDLTNTANNFSWQWFILQQKKEWETKLIKAAVSNTSPLDTRNSVKSKNS